MSLSNINKSTNFAILLNGDVKATDRLLISVKNCRVIAADGGISHSDKLKVMPELWIGDFDSTSRELLEKWSSVKRLSYPPNKDLIDGEIAIDQALQLGASKILLVGALAGKRFDFALQHVAIAMCLNKNNIDVVMTSGTEEAFILTPGKHSFDLPKKSQFSIIALSNIDNLNIMGALYCVSNFSLTFGSSRTISNVVEHNLTIILEKGVAVLVTRPYV
ncbi:MAG: thiamine diphosphokinase [Candidatus Liberibacter europaeus]|uniref:Thiamine diphosphokinase n=1 Tax=Candidatus Liberibacter europaeus TaxID=744859 RepID=A0A2T4VWX6_9HYPH|nr:thiamine diphosphokinase [Candidatus Liberibacter europaeus]PTL86279.1 MAG: thiamine diphosphokinase [Candidatus Liberibacter europaeus]